jgi:ParB family chromosome partitioning protein
MSTIKKGDMSARIARAVQSSPTIGDRIEAARLLTTDHPIPEHGEVTKTTSEYEASVPNKLFESQNRLESSSLHLANPRDAISSPPIAVPLDLIDQNPFNARQIYKPSRVNELASSIGLHGQEQPGIATRRNGRVVLAAGHYRLRALKLLSAKTMILVIHEGLTDKELYAFSYRENAEREPQSTLDNALSWKQMLDDGLFSNETEIAEATKQSLPNVNKTLAALRLTPEALDVVKECPENFGLSTLYELSLFEKLGGTPRTIEFARKVAAGEAGRKEIGEARALLENPKERKKKENSRQYKIQLEGRASGSLKDWDSGKVTFEVHFNDPKERAALVASLKGQFGLTE